ncbi:M14 family zinc carboxypeptidase [Pseudonocardia sp.]|uniref:M14 family zinc carboxypeptidase n=1 Tax=Pseudonocardia sp. TaxID=60912 RepID=UPI003D0C4D7A
MPYLTVEQIESGLSDLRARYPSVTRHIALREPTFEQRTVTALRIGAHGDGGIRAGVLFLANVHANEWGGSDTALSFAADLLRAWETGTGLTYGATVFTPDDIASIIELCDVFVVGCVNPDGRAYSQATPADKDWRKNRRPLSDTDPRIGADINRNFDFLFDIERAFDPSVTDAPTMGSLAPLSDHYQGIGPNSEAETRNIVSLLDDHPNIAWMLDIHCTGGQVMRSWGDAPNQSSRPEMTFFNPAFDGVRGTPDVTRYGEYIDPQDESRMSEAVAAVVGAVNGVRGGQYVGVQLFNRPTPGAGRYNPMSGDTIDYAYSRHLVNPDASCVYGLAIEFGVDDAQPPDDEMREIIADVSAGMVALCLQARRPVVHAQVQEPPVFTPDFRILSGIIDGGPGWVWVNGRPVFVKPPDPRLYEMLRRLGEFQVAPEILGPDAVGTQREALQQVVELAQGLLDEL